MPGGRKLTSLQEQLIWSAAIAAVTLVAFFPSLFNGINNWDDRVYVLENPYTRAFTIENLRWIFSNAFMGNYHPLTMLSLAIDYQITGLHPPGYHLTNLLMHTGSAILVFAVFRRMTGKTELAGIAALLFGVHPMHVESVAWISERKDVLYTLFYLSSLLFYVRYMKKREGRFYWLSLAFFLLSLLSKGQAVTLAISLFLADYFMGKKVFNQKGLLEKIPFLLLAVIFGIVAIRSQQGVNATEMVRTDGMQRILFASYSFLAYIGKLIVPINLSAYYPYPDLTPGASLPFYYYLAPAGVGAYLAALLLSYKRSKAVFFSLAFFLINIVLLLQLLPVGGAMMADRYSYVPSIGYCFLAGHFAMNGKLIRDRKVPFILAGVYIAVLGTATFFRTQVWKNSFSLWHDVVNKDYRVPPAWYNLGNALSDTANYKDAIDAYTQAITVNPKYTNPYINRAVAKTKLGDYLGATDDLNIVIGLDSTLVNAYINRAQSRRSLKDYTGALADYNKSIAMQPKTPELYLNRGMVLADLTDYQSAMKDFERALEIRPDMADAHINKAEIHKRMNDLPAAIADYSAALAIDPENSGVLTNRGNLRLKLGQTQEAIADYNASISVKPGDYLPYQNRAAIYYQLKEFGKARADLDQAVKLSPGTGDLYLTRSMVKKDMDDLEGARADFLKAVELNPGFAGLALRKELGITNLPGNVAAPDQGLRAGQAFENQGKMADAIREYKKVVAEKPGNPEGWYYLGTAYGKTGQFGEAINCLNKALDIRPKYTEALSNRGIVKATMGNTKGALADLTATVELDPGYASAWFNRALVYLNTGKKELACSDLRKAVSLGYTQAYPIMQKECGK